MLYTADDFIRDAADLTLYERDRKHHDVVAHFVQAQREAEEMAAAAAQAARDQKLADWRAELETLCGAEVLTALAPLWGFTSGRPYVTLRYRGRSIEYVQGSNVRTEALARWLRDTDAAIAALAVKQAEFLAAWPTTGAEVTEWNAYHKLLTRLRELELYDAPQVTTVLAALKARLEAQDQARHEAAVADAVARYEHAATWDEYRQVDDFAIRDDNRVRHAVKTAWARIQQMTDEANAAEMQAAHEREARRLAAQAAVFVPFRYYVVRYGLIAWGDDKETVYVEPETILVRHALPDGEGWYTTLRGDRVRFCGPTMVQLIECRDASQLPAQAPWVPTEDGAIQITPPGVEQEV